MDTRTVKLIDPSGNLLALAEVADEGGHYGGTIDLRTAPPLVRELFREFEEIVDDQMFSFLDDIQEKIGALSLKAVFENGHEVPVKNLQVYPSIGQVSFQSAEVLVPSTRPA